MAHLALANVQGCSFKQAPALPAPPPGPPQDKAREFLCSARDSWRVLYRLFMDATLMADFKTALDRTEVRSRGA